MDSEGSRFKRAREAAGMTLQQLAGKIGYSVGTISGIENGHDVPSKRLRKLLIESLKINPAWLASGRGQLLKRGGTPKEASGGEIDSPRDFLQLFGEEIRKAIINVSPADSERGFVRTKHYEFNRDEDTDRWPAALTIRRLNLREASVLLREATDEFDERGLITYSLDCDLDQHERQRMVDALTPFSKFALLRAATILTFGDKKARAILTALGFGTWLAYLTDVLEIPK